MNLLVTRVVSQMLLVDEVGSQNDGFVQVAYHPERMFHLSSQDGHREHEDSSDIQVLSSSSDVPTVSSRGQLGRSLLNWNFSEFSVRNATYISTRVIQGPS
jgi:hypothetical protein